MLYKLEKSLQHSSLTLFLKYKFFYSIAIGLVMELQALEVKHPLEGATGSEW